MSDEATLDECTASGQTETNQDVPPPTELTGVPDDWANVRLAEVAESDNGAFVDGPFGSNLKADEMYADGYARIIQLQNIRESKFVDANHRYISENKFKELSRHGAEAGDLAIAKMSEPVARACLLPDIEDQYLVVADCIKLSVDESAHNTQFVMLTLNSRPVWKQAFARSRGTTRKRINLTQLKQVKVPSPPLPEQRKIAAVLYTVDRAIEKTEEVIGQSERVLKGLNQDIFTTGYYLHSEFRDVRLGPIRTSIPKDWSVKWVSDYFDIIDGDRGKNYPSGSDFSDRGYCLFLSATNVTEDGLKFDEAEFITQQKDDDLRLGKLKRGDIIMTTRGTVGNFGLYDECVDYDNVRINSGMVILRPKANTTCLKYYYHFFRSGIFQRQINATSYGTAQPQTSVTDIKKMGALEPGEDEKKQISKLIECAISKIQTHKKYRNKLQLIKRGLMQDLLSGIVRTADANIEVPDEVAQHG
jgi:type I restriction enzyme S subunit